MCYLADFVDQTIPDSGNRNDTIDRLEYVRQDGALAPILDLPGNPVPALCIGAAASEIEVDPIAKRQQKKLQPDVQLAEFFGGARELVEIAAPVRRGKRPDRTDIERHLINSAEHPEAQAKCVQEVRLVLPYLDRFTIRRYGPQASDLRGKEGAVVAECRADTSPCDRAAYGAAHQVVAAGKLEAMFREFTRKVADTHACLHGHRVAIGVYVFYLVEAGHIDYRPGAGRRAFGRRTVGPHWPKRRQVPGTGIECFT